LPGRTNLVTLSVAQPPEIQVVTQLVAGVTEYITNLVELPPLVITKTVFVPATNYTVTITNDYEVQPVFAKGVEIGHAVNALNPTPTAPLISLGLGALTTVAGLIAGFQTRKLNKQKTTSSTLVDNLETLRTAALQIPQYAELDKRVMQKIQDLQRDKGVKGLIHDLVETQTDYTTEKISP
jgi:hypothetical protein